MRSLIAIAALVASVSTIAQSQVPNVFEDGTPASAADVNENFQYVLENASGGCSVEQVDNTAEITCADGTTAVVPGYGTVVVYPEGLVGEVDPNSINTGDIVAIDAMDVVLGEVRQTRDDSVATIEVAALSDGDYPVIFIANIDSRQSVFVGKWAYNFGTIYFSEENCQGQVILDSAAFVLCRPDTGACFAPVDASYESLLAKSKIKSTYTYDGAVYNEDEECSNVQSVEGDAYLGASYTVAPELLNAAYPVRLEQLP